tara:strand:- start:76 stop:465 length:390 start_codon:yes stop_codon:yes gene_type:complete
MKERECAILKLKETVVSFLYRSKLVSDEENSKFWLIDIDATILANGCQTSPSTELGQPGLTRTNPDSIQFRPGSGSRNTCSSFPVAPILVFLSYTSTFLSVVGDRPADIFPVIISPVIIICRYNFCNEG